MRRPAFHGARAICREDGASIIMLALVLIVLLGFAGIAVDAAAAWALKRQGQSGADTGAVAGALFTADRSQADAMADAEEEIIRISYSTIAPDLTFAEWEAEWASCTDSAKPVEFTLFHTSDCVSFTSNLDKVRVHTPTVPWKTTFARVIGFDEVPTSATAEVNTFLEANGGVLPFGMPGDAENDIEVCLKTGANPKNIAPCDGPDTGNFGFVDFSQFGNDALGTPNQCVGGGTDRLELNIAMGIDHPLGKTTDPLAPWHTDGAACTDGNFNSRPYHVETQTGNVAQALDDGFADGVGGMPGKLATGLNLIPIRGHMLDDTPLWDYLNTAGKDLCGYSISSHEDLITCLADSANYSSPGVWSAGEIFDPDIIDAPRFGWVPLFHEATLGSGTTTLTIKEYRPIYVQTTLWGCNATSCDLVWDPAEAFLPGPNNVRIEASTAINIAAAALPQEVRDKEPGSDSQVSYLLSK